LTHSHRRWTKLVVVVVALAAVVALAGSAVARSTLTRLRGGAAPPPSNEYVTVMVQLHQQPTALVYAQRLHQGAQAKAGASAAAVSHLAVVHAEQQAFATRLAAAKLPRVAELYRLQRAYNGVALLVPRSQLGALSKIPGIKGVWPMTPKRLLTKHSVPWIGVPGIWESLGLDLHGEGMRVGIIDTGIDYIHVNLGGSGDYSGNTSNEAIESGNFPTAKVVGGWDFAGTNYHPESPDPALAIPVPDPDPMDVYGHGTHVSGIVAGYGVTTTGTTYAGPYDQTIDYDGLYIGPGVAPQADLYALKVFGDDATGTNLVAAAIEWALDPHQDGSFTDALHVVNLSLGGDYGTDFDPDTEVYRNATAAGLIVVAAAGNSNDSFFIASNPGSIPEVISVAASVDNSLTYSTLAMLSPSTGTFAIAPSSPAPPFGPAFTPAGVEGPLAWVQTDACGPQAPGSLTGKVALLTDMTSCYYFADIIRYMESLGAIAVVVVAWNDLAPFSMGYWDGPPISIPSGMVWLADGIALVNAVLAAGGTDVVVNLNNTLITATNEGDNVAFFSSRGPSRIGPHVRLKPDIAAPGHMIMSSVAGLGAGGEEWSGTSMATPHVVGVMTLLKQYHDSWTPQELKAVVMNTANHDLRASPTSPNVSPSRIGAGRVDVPQALAATVIAYDQSNPVAVSLAFDTIDVTEVTSETRTIELKPMAASAVTYDVEYVPAVDGSATGVTITPGASTVSVPASGTATLDVTLAADPALMVRTNDGTLGYDIPIDYRYWMSEVSGYVVFTPQGSTGEPSLRVPVYAAVRPASNMHATATSINTSGGAGGVGTATITLAGTGVQPAAAPPIGVASVVTPFQLAYRSPDEDPIGMPYLPPGYDQTRSNEGDIKTVGITNDYVISDPMNVIGALAVETHGVWGSPGGVDVHVYVKRASAPGFQYEVFNQNYYGDQILWTLRDLSTGSEAAWFWFTLGQPVQGDIPVFMTDAMIVPLPFHSLGLTDGDSEVEYVVVTQLYQAFPVDQTPLLRYDPFRPGLGFAPGDMWMMYLDQPDATIDLGFDLEQGLMQRSGGVLLLHHHNGNGHRGEILGVDGLTCTVDADCPASRDTRVCDPYQGACVGCLDATVCLPGEWCDAAWTRGCMPDCRNVEANACAPGNFCDLATGECVADCRLQSSLPCVPGTYCSAASGLCVMANALVVQTPEPPGDNCPNGGVKIESGIDDNGDLVLDPGEVDQTSYVCNALPTLVKAVDIPPGTGPCVNGGQIIYVGVDDNADHVLQESEYDTSWYACNGLNGQNTLLKITDEPAGSNCAAGGKKVETGVDDNGDGELQAGEVDHMEYVCNGVAGDNGKKALVSVTDEAAGDNCAAGGKKVEAGLDANDNGVLDPAEVDQTTYICNGTDGQTGGDGTPGSQSLVETSVLTPGPDCAAGGILIKTGLDLNANGTLDQDEITSVTAVCTGKKGSGCSAAPDSGTAPLGLLLLLGLALLRR
jgi:uncharacterized protein (TIGR03382 family)